MPKKMDRGEPKKECPSCGLGVSLDANICEFCGWDFEEEDEWILQIEKLERDLLLEKQKFQPGTVNHKIESTLISPVQQKVEEEQAAARAAELEEHEEPAQPQVVRASEYLIDRESPAPSLKTEAAPVSAPARAPAPAPAPTSAPVTAPVPVPAPAPAIAPSEEAQGPKVRKVKGVKAPAASTAPERVPAQPLRKVKQPEPAPQAPAPTDASSRKVRTVRKVKG